MATVMVSRPKRKLKAVPVVREYVILHPADHEAAGTRHYVGATRQVRYLQGTKYVTWTFDA